MILRSRRAALTTSAALLGLLAAASPPSPAAAQEFDRLIVFGDSLVDTGQRIDPGKVYPGFPVTLPEDARWRYTNREANGEYGQPYSGRLSEKLGFGPLYPSAPQTGPGMTTEGTGLNYGVGGARAAEVRAQIETLVTVPGTPFHPATTTGPGFLAGPNAHLAKGSLALVSAGGNDIRDMANYGSDNSFWAAGEHIAPFTPRWDETILALETPWASFGAPLTAKMKTAAGETAAGVRALRAAGVDLVILPNAPDLSQTPETVYWDVMLSTLWPALENSPLAQLREQATQIYNAELRESLAGESGVMFVDLNGFFSAVLANPTAFGFAPIAQNQGSVCYNASEFTGVPCEENPDYGFSLAGAGRNPYALLFNDGIHPTVAGHEAVADLIASSLRAGPQVAMAPNLPLLAARDLTSSFEEAAERGARIGAVTAFGSVGASILDGDPGEGRGVFGHVGATKALSPTLTLGAGLGYQSLGGEASDVDFSGSAFMGGLVARHDDGRLFGSAVLTAGYADLDVDRDSRIGAARLKNSGSTEGWVFGGALQAGARLLEGPGFTAGPLARLEGWSSSLDGYAEDGPAYLAQRYGDLDARSFRGGIGGFVEARGASFGARLEALYEHEFLDPRDVKVSSGSLGGAGWKAPGRALADDGLRLGLSVSHDAGFGVVSAGYTARLGDEDGHSLRLGLSMPF